VEQSLLDYDLVSVQPSNFATTIYSFVCFHFGIPYQDVLDMVGYTELDLFSCAVSLYACQRSATSHSLQHIRTRHNTPVTHYASAIVLNDNFLTKIVKNSET